jgi:uncharacterized protein (DUF58 family)
MMLPRSRLLWWVGLVVLPFSVVAAVLPGTAGVAVGIIGLLLALAALDAALARKTLEGIGVTLPKTISLFKDRPGKIELQIGNDQQKARRVRLGLALPREIASLKEDLFADLPEGSQHSRVSWSCTPVQRGQFQLDRCYLEGVSPWGFWAVRKSLPVRAEIRVYPNLLTERKMVAALFLQRGGLGVHVQRQVGKGRDFEKLREYMPGDSFEDIHWKATAKRGRPVTKVFQIERTQQVYVIIDASRLSARSADGLSGNSKAKVQNPKRSVENETTSGRAGFGVPPSGGLGVKPSKGGTPSQMPDRDNEAPQTTLERFITSALIVGLASEQQGDLFGLITFSDKVDNFVRAKNGQAHYGVCRNALYTLQPRIVTPDFDEVSAFIRLRLRRRALLIFLTALDDPLLAESFVRNMDLIARQHLVLVSMMQPPGVQPLFSDANVQSPDDLYRALAGHSLWHNLRELEKVLQRRGVGFALVSHERLSAQLVTQYLSVKQRQLL